MWEGFENEREDYLNSDPVLKKEIRGEAPGSPIRNYREWTDADSGTLLYYRIGFIEFSPDSNAQSRRDVSPAVLAYSQFVESLRIRTAEKVWLVRKKALDALFNQKAKLQRSLMRLSPAAVYHLATAAMAGTDLREMEHFIQQVRDYRETLITYFHDKGAFASHWFGRAGEDMPRFDYQRSAVRTNALAVLPDLALLVLINLLLFMGTFLTFIKQEI